MRILGIDPGLVTTGYGIIDARGQDVKLYEAGVIKTSPKDKLQDRLIDIYDNLIRIIGETSPQAAAIEKLYSHYRHPTTSILMGHVRGVVYLAIRKKRLELFEYPAKRIKKSTTGRGDASKEQVGRMVQMRLNLKQQPHPADVTDALALALSHVSIGMSKFVREEARMRG